MLHQIIYGQKVYRCKSTTTGLYFDVYRVSEKTGRTDLKVVTVVPLYVWEDFKSPYYNSYELPVEDLITEDEVQTTVNERGMPLHPAMTI